MHTHCLYIFTIKCNRKITECELQLMNKKKINIRHYSKYEMLIVKYVTYLNVLYKSIMQISGANV